MEHAAATLGASPSARVPARHAAAPATGAAGCRLDRLRVHVHVVRGHPRPGRAGHPHDRGRGVAQRHPAGPHRHRRRARDDPTGGPRHSPSPGRAAHSVVTPVPWRSTTRPRVARPRTTAERWFGDDRRRRRPPRHRRSARSRWSCGRFRPRPDGRRQRGPSSGRSTCAPGSASASIRSTAIRNSLTTACLGDADRRDRRRRGEPGDRRRRGRLGRLLDTGSMLPIATSAVTIGFGMLITFDTAAGRLARRRGGSCRSARRWWRCRSSYATVSGVLRSVDPALSDAAMTLGASPARAWRHVVVPVPLAPPGIGRRARRRDLARRIRRHVVPVPLRRRDDADRDRSAARPHRLDPAGPGIRAGHPAGATTIALVAVVELTTRRRGRRRSRCARRLTP